MDRGSRVVKNSIKRNKEKYEQLNKGYVKSLYYSKKEEEEEE